MKKFWKIPVLLVLLILLVGVRMLEETLFYDPFMHFFQGCMCEETEAFSGEWYLNVALRFLINTFISLAIIYVVFQSKASVKFSGILFLILFVILFPVFVFLMERVEKDDYLAVFYVRRFLVQPILILLLLPALYYQRIKDRNS